MCRWPEVLLLVGQCSEEPVVTLQAKKTRTALICTCTCVQIVQRQLYASCCYIASCTVDLRTTQTYGSYVLIFQDSRHAQATHLRLYDNAPLRWRQLRGLLSWLDKLKWGGEDWEVQDQLHRGEALLNFRTSGLWWWELRRRTSWIFAWLNCQGFCKFVPNQVEQSCRGEAVSRSRKPKS